MKLSSTFWDLFVFILKQCFFYIEASDERTQTVVAAQCLFPNPALVKKHTTIVTTCAGVPKVGYRYCTPI